MKAWSHRNPKIVSLLRLDCNLDQVVIRHAIDQQQQGIDSGFVRLFIRGESVAGFAAGHVHPLAVQDFAKALSLLGRGQRSNFDPVVHRNFGFVAFFVGFELARLGFDRDLVLAVRPFVGGRGHRPIGK